MLFLLRTPAALLGVALALVVGVVAHSLAQAATARAFGDRLPAANGRLSPDPRRHFEPFGVIVMIISGLGWNKPVPLQEPRFRGARTRYLLSILAGPFTNLVLGLLGMVGYWLTRPELVALDPEDARLGFTGVLLLEFAVVNVGMAVLTLLPIPPLDGARILWLYAPQTPGWRNARYQLEERNIGLAIVVFLMLPLFGGSGLLMRIVTTVTDAILIPLADALGV